MKDRKKMTVREIIDLVFNSKKYTVIQSEETTTKETLSFFNAIKNKTKIFNVIDNGTHLLIWE